MNITNMVKTEKNMQFVVYDNYSGTPILTTFLGNCWWITTPGLKLQPLEECLGGDDVSFYTQHRQLRLQGGCRKVGHVLLRFSGTHWNKIYNFISHWIWKS